VFGAQMPIARTSAEVHDLDADTWETLPDLPIPMTYATCAVVGTSIYIVGNESAEILEFNTTTKTFSPPIPIGSETKV
jgi:N-acetylneuraminic acid mutarotase